jgi:alpha-L-fucosidase
MIRILYLVILAWIAPGYCSFAQPRPTATQWQWHQQEFYLFMHFGPNTFTGKEWGHGDEKEEIFNPGQLDTDQWCRIAQAAGAKGIIITAKHHDGFCLWPSAYSKHTVRESQWKNGKGDVLLDLSNSCQKFGLKFGVYISPWDRNHPAYGTDAYNDVYVNTMQEIFSKYGPIWELWWDGANGEGPNGKKQVYDFPRFEKLIRRISPGTVIFSDIGPDLRWVGNESGIAGETNWNMLDTAGFKRGEGGPPTDTLNRGNAFGKHWIPAECDVSIRPGWFYHQEEDDKVKTPLQLFDLYLKSVGRGANLLLNVPPDTRGLIHPNDSAALMGFRELRSQWDDSKAIRGKCRLESRHEPPQELVSLQDGNIETAVPLKSQSDKVVLQLQKPAEINGLVLQEDLREGQHCAGFVLTFYDAEGSKVREVKGSTMGRKRILTFPTTLVQRIECRVTDQRGNVLLGEMKAFRIQDALAGAGQ